MNDKPVRAARGDTRERCPTDAKICERGCKTVCERARGIRLHNGRTLTHSRGWPTLLTTDGRRELNKDKPHIRLHIGEVAGFTAYHVSFMSGAATGRYAHVETLQPVVARRLRAHRLLA